MVRVAEWGYNIRVALCSRINLQAVYMAPPRTHTLREACRRSLDINALSREGMIRPGANGLLSFPDGAQFGFHVWQYDTAHYEDASQAFPGGMRLTGEGVMHEIGLAWSGCHYGGERPWFLCPACNGRVAKLFDYGRGFQCRQCHDYRYRSQSRGQVWRLLDKANKLRARLEPDETRPKGMHGRTYQRLLEEITELDMRSLGIIASRFE